MPMLEIHPIYVLAVSLFFAIKIVVLNLRGE